MSKIYDANGNKMDLAGICAELVRISTDEQKRILANAIAKYDDSENDAQYAVAHGILDCYSKMDSVSEQGMRVRKLMDNLMTKYQKSTAKASVGDMDIYKDLISKLQ